MGEGVGEGCHLLLQDKIKGEWDGVPLCHSYCWGVSVSMLLLVLVLVVLVLQLPLVLPPPLLPPSRHPLSICPHCHFHLYILFIPSCPHPGSCSSIPALALGSLSSLSPSVASAQLSFFSAFLWLFCYRECGK